MESRITRARQRRAVALAILLVGFMLAPGVPGDAAAAPNDPCAPANEIVDAMVTQFGLTQKEARDRIRAECKASEIRLAAQAAAGEAFAGAFFDKSSAVLVVAVTNRAVFDAVAATGAQPRLVAASYADLEQDLHVLDSRVGTQPAQVTGWRIDEEANTVVVDVVGGPTQGVKTFVAGLNHVRVDYGQLPVSTTAELLGGMAIFRSGSRCSLGFNARNAAGTVFVLTAGHCTNLGGTWTSNTGSTIGTVSGSSFPTNDYGRIQRTNSTFVPTSKVLTYPNMTSVLGKTVAAVGTSVCRSGSTTGYKCGTIQAMNQTVCYSQGCVYQMTRTTACAEPGDSGGPYISTSRQAQGMTSGGSGNCTTGGTTFFQPVNEVLSVYGLTLVTG